MRVLLDECLPKRLKADLAAHDAQTVAEAGWAGKSNGELLSLAEPRFDVLLTIDANLIHQQAIKNRAIAVVVIHLVSNRYEQVKPLMGQVVNAISVAAPGTITHIRAE